MRSPMVDGNLLRSLVSPKCVGKADLGGCLALLKSSGRTVCSFSS